MELRTEAAFIQIAIVAGSDHQSAFLGDSDGEDHERAREWTCQWRCVGSRSK